MKNIKKISYCLFLLLILFTVVSPVLADDITCTFISGVKIDTKIADTVHAIILVIQIVVPILLVVFGSIDFIKAVVAQKDDEIKKGQQTFIKRLIAGVIVFFIFAIVKLLVSFAAGDDSSDILNCADCFLNGSSSEGCVKAQGTAVPDATESDD